MREIGVFCSANDLPEKYTKPATEFARLLAQNGYNLVWGGSDVGLMKLIADTVQQHGGKLIGVSVEYLASKARKKADEMIIAKDLGERKRIMLERSDAFVVLVGGVGTLDEVTEIMELKKHGRHTKPIIVLNTDNFYTGFKTQLEKMKDEGSIAKPLDELLFFVDTPQQAIEYLNKSLA